VAAAAAHVVVKAEAMDHLVQREKMVRIKVVAPLELFLTANVVIL